MPDRIILKRQMPELVSGAVVTLLSLAGPQVEVLVESDRAYLAQTVTDGGVVPVSGACWRVVGAVPGGASVIHPLPATVVLEQGDAPALVVRAGSPVGASPDLEADLDFTEGTALVLRPAGTTRRGRLCRLGKTCTIAGERYRVLAAVFPLRQQTSDASSAVGEPAGQAAGSTVPGSRDGNDRPDEPDDAIASPLSAEILLDRAESA